MNPRSHAAAAPARPKIVGDLQPRLAFPRRAFLGRVGRLMAALVGGGMASRGASVAAARGVGRRAARPTPPGFAYVGCDTTKPRQGHGEGLTVYRVDFGNWTSVQVVPDLVNPAALALDPSGTWLYAANAGSDTIVTFRTDPATGTLDPTGQIVQTESPVAILFRERDVRLSREGPHLRLRRGGRAGR